MRFGPIGFYPASRLVLRIGAPDFAQAIDELAVLLLGIVNLYGSIVSLALTRETGKPI